MSTELKIPHILGDIYSPRTPMEVVTEIQQQHRGIWDLNRHKILSQGSIKSLWDNFFNNIISDKSVENETIEGKLPFKYFNIQRNLIIQYNEKSSYIRIVWIEGGNTQHPIIGMTLDQSSTGKIIDNVIMHSTKNSTFVKSNNLTVGQTTLSGLGMIISVRLAILCAISVSPSKINDVAWIPTPGCQERFNQVFSLLTKYQYNIPIPRVIIMMLRIFENKTYPKEKSLSIYGKYGYKASDRKTNIEQYLSALHAITISKYKDELDEKIAIINNDYENTLMMQELTRLITKSGLIMAKSIQYTRNLLDDPELLPDMPMTQFYMQLYEKTICDFLISVQHIEINQDDIKNNVLIASLFTSFNQIYNQIYTIEASRLKDETCDNPFIRL